METFVTFDLIIPRIQICSSSAVLEKLGLELDNRGWSTTQDHCHIFTLWVVLD